MENGIFSALKTPGLHCYLQGVPQSCVSVVVWLPRAMQLVIYFLGKDFYYLEKYIILIGFHGDNGSKSINKLEMVLSFNLCLMSENKIAECSLRALKENVK